MAGGGKVSARQKMINLMYLIFIAMMAMQMSKEVLSAFGLMEEKFAYSNVAATESNGNMLADLMTKGEEKPEEFANASNKAQQINTISDNFFNYLEGLKRELLNKGEYAVDPATGKLPFEDMEKTDVLDEIWFTGDRLTKAGDAVMAAIGKYKSDVKEVLGDDVKYRKAIENFDRLFDTSNVTDSEGVSKKFLDYHFQGFPAIASYTKLTAMQNDVKVTETGMYNLFLGNTLTDAVSLNKYKAIVIADKSAFFAGETFKGKVVIGKYANVPPTKLVVQGREVDLSKAIDSTGAAKLDFNVGNVGEKEINGEFTFLEDGKELKIPIKGNYVVVPKPNSATISADKMNVVYRGVSNPMTISFAGVADNNVTASGSGLSAGTGSSYTMNPGTGREVSINVTARLPNDGGTVTDSKKFRIKDIPRPTGTIRGEDGDGACVKMQRQGLERSSIGAELLDFDFDLKLNVSGFSMKVSGQPTVRVNGTKLNSQAKGALKRAKRGETVQIFDIQAKISGNSGYRLRKISPICIELTN